MPLRRICIDCSGQCFPKYDTDAPRCRSCAVKNRAENAKFKTRVEYARDWTLRKKYGIDSEGFDVLWYAFEGKCGICSKQLTLPASTRGQKPSAACVDHDHKTGNIRGLLCNSCNKGLGLFQDSAEICRKALNWLGETDE